MSKRNYNVFFNTHTVSGIVISVALYVIFFAGAFALFKEEIAIWEEGKPISNVERQDIDFDHLFEGLDQEHDLLGRDLQINFGGEGDKLYIYMTPSKDSLASEKGKIGSYFSLDINTEKTKKYNEYYSLGEFLYRLHFFHQLPVIGLYLAGLVALFLLFAIVTGVIVHWKKVVSNFYNFNPKSTLKRVWTDAHTALGVIGLPFQFIFAVTGAYFGLSILVLLPANFLYNGDQNKLMEDLRPSRTTYEWVDQSHDALPSFNKIVKQSDGHWDNFHLTRALVSNYQGTNMKYILMGELEEHERFVGTGQFIYHANTGKTEIFKDPNKVSYIEDSQRIVGRLHFGDFGGLPVKFIYFLLALVTCFVIITGVLIWIEARNKKSMSISQRLYTAKVGHIYLAICLSILPVTALSFIYVKIVHGYFDDKQNAIYWFFFVSWLVFILFFRFLRNNYLTNKYNLLLGAILGYLIPVVNGIVSGNWIWVSFNKHQYEILLVDVLWIVLATISLLTYFKLKPEVTDKSAFAKNPIDYKNLKALKVQEKSLHENAITTLTKEIEQKDKNHIPMRTKISILWIFLAIGWIVHHLYGLFNVYYIESLIMEGATGEAPLEHHLYRIVFEGLCLLFGLLTLEVVKPWFRLTSLIFASIAGLYNVYHLITAVIYEPSNVSEIFMLALVVVASFFLVRNINLWKKEG